MNALRTIGAFFACVFGFVLFCVWLCVWKIPRNIVKEFDDYKD